MSSRVAVLFGRDDDGLMDLGGAERLESISDRLAPFLRAIGYSDLELADSWRLIKEPNMESSWWYWRDDIALSIAPMGCCLQTGILWRAFIEDDRLRNSCRGMVKAIASCFRANTALFAPDSSDLYNSGCSQLQQGGSFSSVVSSLKVDDRSLAMLDRW